NCAALLQLVQSGRVTQKHPGRLCTMPRGRAARHSAGTQPKSGTASLQTGLEDLPPVRRYRNVTPLQIAWYWITVAVNADRGSAAVVSRAAGRDPGVVRRVPDSDFMFVAHDGAHLMIG